MKVVGIRSLFLVSLILLPASWLASPVCRVLLLPGGGAACPLQLHTVSLKETHWFVSLVIADSLGKCLPLVFIYFFRKSYQCYCNYFYFFHIIIHFFLNDFASSCRKIHMTMVTQLSLCTSGALSCTLKNTKLLTCRLYTAQWKRCRLCVERKNLDREEFPLSRSMRNKWWKSGGYSSSMYGAVRWYQVEWESLWVYTSLGWGIPSAPTLTVGVKCWTTNRMEGRL